MLGNAELPHRATTRSFAEGFAWLAQIGLFIMLGLLVSPGTIGMDEVVDGIVIARRAHADRATDQRAGLRAAVPVAVAGAGFHRVRRSARRGADRAGHDPARRAGRSQPRTCSTSCS